MRRFESSITRPAHAGRADSLPARRWLAAVARVASTARVVALVGLSLLAVSAVGAASARAQSGAPSAPTSRPDPIEGVVNVNSATVDQLRLLPGVGPARAKSIVAYRDQNGPFEQVRDLLAVSGIGERALARMQKFIVLSGETTARRAGATPARSQ